MSRAMQQKEFDELLEQLRGVRTDKDRARILKQAIAGCTVTAEQAIDFVHCQHGFDGKNQAAILSYESLDDKGTMDKVLAALKFPEDRTEVKKALGLN